MCLRKQTASLCKVIISTVVTVGLKAAIKFYTSACLRRNVEM